MTYLVIGGGGQYIFSFLGAIKKLDPTITEISGASAGSLIGLLLAIGWDIDRITDFFISLVQSDFIKPQINNLFTNYGLIDSEPFKRYLIDFIGFEPTFKDLKIKLYVSAYNLTYDKTEYFSCDTYPDMSVVDAVCMSACIPFLISCPPFRDSIYIDGGSFEYAPVIPFMNKPVGEVLVVMIELPDCTYSIRNFKDFCLKIFLKYLSFSFNSTCHDVNVFKTIKIPQLEHVTSVTTDISDNEKWKLFFHGYKFAERQMGGTM